MDTQTEQPQTANLSYLKIASLKRNPQNPRGSNPKDMGFLVDSIRKNGFIVPMVVKPNDKEPGTYIILNGNHRYEACKLLDIEEVPAFILPTGLTDKQETELIFLLNRNFAEFDKGKSKDMLKQYSELINKIDFDRLGIRFIKPQDFVSDNPIELKPEMADTLSKVENLKSVVEKIIRDSAEDIRRNYLVFEHRKNKFMVLIVNDSDFTQLEMLQREKSAELTPYIVGKIFST